MDLIKQYLEDHSKAWSSSTLKSEASRLNAIKEFLDGDADKLWLNIQSKKPYSRVTLWTRVVDFWDWGMKKGAFAGLNANPYRAWREKNARLFKNTYQRKTPQVSFEEAKVRINTISSDAIRSKAYQLLFAGLRFSEHISFNPSPVVIGKGGKVREVFLPPSGAEVCEINHWKFWKALKDATGLKPHDLRKIKATDLLRQGMDLISICKVMGWSSTDTATAYLAPIHREEMEKFFK